MNADQITEIISSSFPLELRPVRLFRRDGATSDSVDIQQRKVVICRRFRSQGGWRRRAAVP
jgi:hypothetical protein